eukprot:12403539-Karenia_brevis.AAC.1
MTFASVGLTKFHACIKFSKGAEAKGMIEHKGQMHTIYLMRRERREAKKRRRVIKERKKEGEGGGYDMHQPVALYHMLK